MKRAFAATAVFSCLAAFAFAQSPSTSQTKQSQIPSSPETLLGRQETAFRARVERPVTRDMYAQGRLVAMGGTPDGAAIACISCHRLTGEGDSAGVFPRISEFPAWYLYKQLGDYASGSRPNAIMTPIAQRLSAQQREAVSAYYALTPSEIDSGRNREIDEALVQWGAKLSAIGSAERGIPACVNCHGPEGEGLPPSVPNLAGQHGAYIVSQLQAWKVDKRRNDPMGVMKAIADKMQGRDMEAVGEYFSRLQANPKVSPNRDRAWLR